MALPSAAIIASHVRFLIHVVHNVLGGATKVTLAVLEL